MRKLDLHGIYHSQVKTMVEEFIYVNQNEFPLEIVCGNSNKMISIVREVTDRLNLETHSYRYGVIIIRGWL